MSPLASRASHVLLFWRLASVVLAMIIALAAAEAAAHVHGISDPHAGHSVRAPSTLGQIQPGYAILPDKQPHIVVRVSQRSHYLRPFVRPRNPGDSSPRLERAPPGAPASS